MDATDLVPFSEIQRRRVEWVVDGLIPMGMLSVLAGPPKLGKSLLYCAWAKLLAEDGRASILVNAEDSPEHTTKPRLEALQARADLISHAQYKPTFGNGSGDAAYRRIAEWIIDRRADLLVLDPFAAFVDTHADVYRDHHVRALLEPLDYIARETGCAIVYVKHLTKGSDTDLLTRISDSIGFTAAARSVIGVTREGEPGSLSRFITHAASNVSELSPVQRWRIIPTLLPADNSLPEVKTARIEYVEVAEGITALDVLKPPPSAEETGEQERAEELIHDMLGFGSMPSRDLDAAAEAQGISRRTLERARAAVGVTATKKGRQWHVELCHKVSPPSQDRQTPLADFNSPANTPGKEGSPPLYEYGGVHPEGVSQSPPAQGSLDWLGTASWDELQKGLDN